MATTYISDAVLHVARGHVIQPGEPVDAALLSEDEIARLRREGALLTPAEKMGTTAAQAAMDAKDAEIARLREELDRVHAGLPVADQDNAPDGPAKPEATALRAPKKPAAK
jgi:hypothetical protein